MQEKKIYCRKKENEYKYLAAVPKLFSNTFVSDKYGMFAYMCVCVWVYI